MGRDEIEAGMSLIKERNKFLILADSFRWGVALCYAKEPLAEDSEDERKICRAKKEGKIRRDERLKSKLKPSRRYSAPIKTQSPVSGFRGFPPNGPSSQSHAGVVGDQDIMLVFAEHQSHPPILDKHLGLVEGFQTPISEFSANVSLKSSNCVNFSEDLSCKKLSLFNKSLISNESDGYEALGPCVLSDDFGNSLVDLPKEPLVKTFEDVSDINVKNRLTSHAQFWRDIGASPWVMRVIDQGYSLPFIVEPPPAFLRIISLL